MDINNQVNKKGVRPNKNNKNKKKNNKNKRSKAKTNVAPKPKQHNGSLTGVPQRKVGRENKENINSIKPFNYFEDVKMDGSVHRIVEDITMDLNNIYLAIYTYASRMYYLNKLASTVNNYGVSYTDVSQGLGYLCDAILSYSKGATPEATKVPLIFGILMKMLTARTVKVGKSGYVNYSPQWDDNTSLPQSYTTPIGSKFTLAEPSPLDYTIITFNSEGSSKDGYSSMTRVTDDTQYFGTKFVDLADIHGLFERDPSAFARNYTYFGSAGTSTSGLYSEAEIEVPFFYPQFSKFVRYDTQDKVISRVFHPQSGGISTAIGLPLLLSPKDYTYSDLKNPIPVIYKFLDFYQFYTQVGYWLSNLFSVSPGVVQGTNFTNKPDTLPFSYTDFIMALRQAVLINYPDQCHAQFVAPIQTNDNSQSIFQPFIVDSIGYPKSNANKLMLPSFFIENLSMLTAVRIKPSHNPKYNVKNKKVSFNIVPVWGVYDRDTPPEFTFSDAEGNLVPLFSSSNMIPPCNVWDLVSSSNTNQKININNFVDQIIDIFNERITIYASNKGAKLDNMNVDRNKNTTLLHYTRILEKFPVDITSGGKDWKHPSDIFIVNKPKMEKQSSKKNVKAIEPATYYQLYTNFITSATPISLDLAGNLRYLFLPSIRLNPQGSPPSDVMTANAYQVYTGELDSVYSTNGLIAYTSAEIYRLYNVAALVVTGPFSATDESNVLVEALASVTRNGQGSDLITSLLGGLASMIPVVGPVLGGLLNGI